jgi:AbrB family looped-hinge helix DNA binding protein
VETEAPAHHILRIDDRGRIPIPAELRNELGIGRGTWVELQRASDNSLNLQLLSNRDSRINALMWGDFQSRSEDDPLTMDSGMELGCQAGD